MVGLFNFMIYPNEYHRKHLLVYFLVFGLWSVSPMTLTVCPGGGGDNVHSLVTHKSQEGLERGGEVSLPSCLSHQC